MSQGNGRGIHSIFLSLSLDPSDKLRKLTSSSRGLYLWVTKHTPRQSFSGRNIPLKDRFLDQTPWAPPKQVRSQGKRSTPPSRGSKNKTGDRPPQGRIASFSQEAAGEPVKVVMMSFWGKNLPDRINIWQPVNRTPWQMISLYKQWNNCWSRGGLSVETCDTGSGDTNTVLFELGSPAEREHLLEIVLEERKIETEQGLCLK